MFENYRRIYPSIAPTLMRVLGWRFVELLDMVVRDYLRTTYVTSWYGLQSQFHMDVVDDATMFIETQCDFMVADGSMDFDDVKSRRELFDEEIKHVIDEVQDMLKTQLPDRDICMAYDPRWISGELVVTVEFYE